MSTVLPVSVLIEGFDQHRGQSERLKFLSLYAKLTDSELTATICSSKEVEVKTARKTSIPTQQRADQPIPGCVTGARQFKLRMSHSLHKHVSKRADLLDVTLSEYARDALSFYSYVVDQVSTGGAIAFLDKDGAQHGEFWIPELARVRAQSESVGE